MQAKSLSSIHDLSNKGVDTFLDLGTGRAHHQMGIELLLMVKEGTLVTIVITETILVLAPNDYSLHLQSSEQFILQLKTPH